jgi:hypothetical protein
VDEGSLGDGLLGEEVGGGLVEECSRLYLFF